MALPYPPHLPYPTYPPYPASPAALLAFDLPLDPFGRQLPREAFRVIAHDVGIGEHLGDEIEIGHRKLAQPQAGGVDYESHLVVTNDTKSCMWARSHRTCLGVYVASGFRACEKIGRRGGACSAPGRPRSAPTRFFHTLFSRIGTIHCLKTPVATPLRNRISLKADATYDFICAISPQAFKSMR